ncbi:MAG: hypothetical protein K1W17_04030 [Oscillospiraceae bacterium]
MNAPSFKEILNSDIKSVFLNPSEFGEEHNVQGKTMVIVLDDMENIEREKKVRSDGFFTKQILFYVSAEDFGEMPSPNGLITLDGKRYTVVDATDEAGIYAITLDANRSRR